MVCATYVSVSDILFQRNGVKQVNLAQNEFHSVSSSCFPPLYWLFIYAKCIQKFVKNILQLLFYLQDENRFVILYVSIQQSLE